MKKKKRPLGTHAQNMQDDFYGLVYDYVCLEYSRKISILFLESEIAASIESSVSEYFWGGNTVPFVAGEMVNRIKQKYGKK